MTINTQHPEYGSGLRREAGEICSLLWYFAACSGNSLPTFRGSWTVFDFLTLADGTNRLSRNVGGELPLYAA